eukprot:s943_g4.t1
MERLLVLALGVIAVLCRPSAFVAPQLRQLRTHNQNGAVGRGSLHSAGGPDLAWFGLGAAVLLVPSLSRARARSPVSRAAGPVLFGSPGSRSPLVNWYLHEIGQDFELVDAARYSTEYPSPFGKIPALADGDLQVFESGAILMFLADKYGGLDTPEKRAEVQLAAQGAVKHATFAAVVEPEDGNGRVLDTGLRGDPPALQVLDGLLEANEFLLGSGEESFSVADVAVGSYLLYDRYYKDIFRDLPKDRTGGTFCSASSGLKNVVFAAKSHQAPLLDRKNCWCQQSITPSGLTPQQFALGDRARYLDFPESSSDSSSSQPLSDGYEYVAWRKFCRHLTVVPWESCGIYPAVFWTYSFKPPRGTSSLTPFAAFKLRGVWEGEAIEWDPTHGSEERLFEMDWFTNMAPELRRQLADPKLLEGPHKIEVESLPRPKREKELPVLWPENSWQGNVAKAKIWDQLQQDAFAASFNRLSEELGQHWSELNIIPQLQTLVEHKNYLYRISAILSTRALAEVSGSDFIDKHLVPMVVKLTNDPVPNVRFNAAKTILAMHQVCGKSTPKSFDGQLVPCLYRLLQDQASEE